MGGKFGSAIEKSSEIVWKKPLIFDTLTSFRQNNATLKKIAPFCAVFAPPKA
jgi:hypothetical protein